MSLKSAIADGPANNDFDDIDIDQPNTASVTDADNALDVAEQGGTANDIPPQEILRDDQVIDNVAPRPNDQVIDNVAPRPLVGNLEGGDVRRSARVKTSTKETVLKDYVA